MGNTKIREYANYCRVNTYVRDGKRIHYRHKLTDLIFSDGFFLKGGRRMQIREGERLFDISRILQKSKEDS